ncbi:hypothetical protein [Chitinophaga cymbidii]|uniref:hypothetical protein n=1 Tax=Chitinophaga cymbidii TaxID=1096750 RepID=UPI0011BF4422|nr:hypothetical protein [Chitinophaga cymbidii]
MNRILHVRRRFFLSTGAILLVLVAFFSCSKEGTQELIPEFSKVNFEIRSLKQAPVLYSIKVNDFTIADSAAIVGQYTNVVERAATPQRLSITEIYSNTVLLDTMITIPAGESTYTIYQIDTAESAQPLFIVGGQATDVPVDSFMMAFYVNDPAFPETFDILVYKVVDFAYAEVPPVHIYKDVKRGSFTEFSLFVGSGFFMAEVRTPDGEMIPGMLPIDPQNPFGGGGTVEARCGFNINNHQIIKMAAADMGDGTYAYYQECMFMY